MTGPGEFALGFDAPDQGPGFVSPELAALGSALAGLLAASDRVTDAVTRHDRPALEAANADAETLMAEIGRMAAELTPADRPFLAEIGIPATCERLAIGSRRNAYLIEQAWAVDAALMRLLLGLGRPGADGPISPYASAPGPTWLDRQA
jgi:hypothetical protein